MIQDEWLSDVLFTTVQSGADLGKVKTARGDFQTGALSQAVNNNEINTITVRSWLARAQKRRSTLVFCVDIAHVTSLTAAFRQHGIDAHFVTGSTKASVRHERLAAFRAKEFPVLLNCGIFTEGTDIPNIDCVLLARPTKSRNLLVQMIGRGLRKTPGKINCHVIDMVASLETGIVTTPTLFGLDPSEVIDEADSQSIQDMQKRKAKERIEGAPIGDLQADTQSRALSGNITFTDYDTVTDLIADTSGERHIRALSPFSWVRINPKKYILGGIKGDYIVLTLVNDEYDVSYIQKLPPELITRSPYMRPRQLAKAQTFEDAIHAADTFAAEKFPFELIHKSAKWRKRPATAAQVDLLNKHRGADDQLTVDKIATGKAGDMITKIKHGAKGRFNAMQTQKRQARRDQDKQKEVEERRRRAQVRVGPVDS